MIDAVVLISLYVPFLVMGITIHRARRGSLGRDLIIAFLLVHVIGGLLLFGMGMPVQEAVWLVPAASLLGSYVNFSLAQSQPLLALPFILSLVGVVLSSGLVTPGRQRAPGRPAGHLRYAAGAGETPGATSAADLRSPRTS